jgi:hypothetical protein
MMIGEAKRMSERTQSPAYLTLRPSSRRLLAFIEGEIARGGGGPVTLYADQLAVVGSRNVLPPGLSELRGLGLIDWQRFPKRHSRQVSMASPDVKPKAVV